MSESLTKATPPRPTPPRTEVVRLKNKRKPRPRTVNLVIGLVLAAAGIVAAIISTFSLQGEGWLQFGAYLLTAILLFQAFAYLGRAWRGNGFDASLWLCSAWLILLVGAAFLAPILPFGEYENSAATLDEPIMARPDLLSPNLLGTNNLGLDMLARIVYGARISLVVALIAVGLGMIVGGLLGIIAGFYRKVPDRIISIFTNSLLAVPPLILLIALATVLEPNIWNLSFALMLMALPSMVRIARANTLTFAQREFVLAGRSMGASNWRLMFSELLPNVFLPLASYGMVMVSVLIVAEASLSFLGLGTPPPTPTWGNMIAEGEGMTFQKHPHIVLVPGITLFLTVFSFNMLGEKARAHFDSRKAKV